MGDPSRLISLCCHDIKRGTALLLGFPMSQEKLVRPMSSTGTIHFRRVVRRRLGAGLITKVAPGISGRHKKSFITSTLASSGFSAC